MNTFLEELDSTDDPWNRFVSAMAQDPSIPAKARPHLVRWVSLWQRAAGPDSPEATQAFFEEPGRRPHLKSWQFRQALQAVQPIANKEQSSGEQLIAIAQC